MPDNKFKKKERREFRKLMGICLDCGKNAVAKKVKCVNCMVKASNKRKQRSQKGLCASCGKQNDSGFINCDSCRKKVSNRSHEIKLEVMIAYGGLQCACCGTKVVEFLNIDHIKDNGAAHRRELFGRRNRCGDHFYRWLIKNDFPPGYQVLCFNCNYAKTAFGKCPCLSYRQVKIVQGT